LQENKAIGLDDIAPLFLMDPTGAELKSDDFTHILTQLFNIVFKSGIYPNEWKWDRRVPLFKKGDKMDVEKYTLNCVISVYIHYS